ncbi:MAG: glycosyltransferase family 4 protein [Inhella sp.]|jgi:colanic acid biosynthesis glycosyl transferase WcaI|nr:glycosyltransferase family 4 protein [Inhella sp.]
MRVLVVSQYFWPEVFRVNEIVADLVRRGHEVTVLTGRPNYPDGRVFDAYINNPRAFSSYAGAEVLRVPLRPRRQGSLRLMLNYWSFVFWGCLLGPWWLRGRSFDSIFVFETSPITSAIPAVLLKWLKQARLTIWVLDLWPDTLSAIGVLKSPWLLGLVGHLVAWIYRHCDLILAQSYGFFKPIERWSRDARKTRYFPQWAEADFDAPALARATVAAELAPHDGRIKIMFAGNLGEAQDLPAVLDAAERLRERSDIHWLLVGDGRAAAMVREQIQRRGLTQTVFMLGRHPLERMPDFFKGADALLVSLKPEPIFALTVPGKVQSYLASGRPVIAMLDGEGAEVIGRSGAGLTCPAGRPDLLAERVLQLAALDKAQRDAMGQRGQAFARNEFGRQGLMDQFEGWLQGQG